MASLNRILAAAGLEPELQDVLSFVDAPPSRQRAEPLAVSPAVKVAERHLGQAIAPAGCA